MPDRARDAAERCGILWSERIDRAGTLAGSHLPAAELLTFYAALAEFQRSLIAGSPSTAAVPVTDASFRNALDLKPALQAIPRLLPWLSAHAPAPLAGAAGELDALDRGIWRAALEAYWADDEPEPGGVDSTMAFVAAVLVQPFAERLAFERRGDDDVVRTTESSVPSARCPMCGGPPVVGVLREASHGAKRALVCATCLTECDYQRVLCPACNEQRFDALPVFTADAFEHVRIDACDTCRTYLKTIDLSKNGLAVPLVDDIASVSLDLWARERGYTRPCPNLLRT